jgi:hypothetical protein
MNKAELVHDTATSSYQTATIELRRQQASSGQSLDGVRQEDNFNNCRETSRHSQVNQLELVTKLTSLFAKVNSEVEEIGITMERQYKNKIEARFKELVLKNNFDNFQNNEGYMKVIISEKQKQKQIIISYVKNSSIHEINQYISGEARMSFLVSKIKELSIKYLDMSN